MADKTGINWTNATWNPIRGCKMKNPDCWNCYAMKMAHRFNGPGQPYEGLTKLVNGKPVWTGKVATVPHMLHQPLQWQRPRLIFVNSMSDLGFETLGLDVLTPIVEVMARAKWHIFQVLTKRPEHLAELVPQITLSDGRNMGTDPLENVWWGASIGCDANGALADDLARIPAVIRWISAEPLHQNVNWNKWLPRSKSNWVVFGGESQDGARELKDEWITEGIGVCDSLNISPYTKQMGTIWAKNHLTAEAFKADNTAESFANIPASCQRRDYPVDVAKTLAWDGKAHKTMRDDLSLPVLS